jgi:hypothetical protein
MGLLASLLAIEWDPDVTGYLAVLIGVGVLCGSVYLLLATNLGTRLGFLVAFTGLFAWMFLMGIVWWIYAIGYIGSPPSWQEVQATTDLSSVPVEAVRLLEGMNPNDPVPDEWREIPVTERGDIDAAVDEILTADDRFGFEGDTQAYQKFRVLETGGERYRVLGIPENAVTEIFIPSRSKPRYALVQVQAFEEAEPIDLNAEGGVPDPVLDPEAEIINVVLVRDRGDQRLPPAMITIFSGAMFGIGAWMLHRRDKAIAATRAAVAAA